MKGYLPFGKGVSFLCILSQKQTVVIMSPRHTYSDLLKAFAIFLVVYAHCLQHLGLHEWMHHPFIKFIYAFHMPLFMTLSGYWTAHSLHQPFKELLRKKAIRLLLPCISAGVMVIVFNQLVEVTDRYNDWKEFVGNLWYLKSLFVCTLFVKVILIGMKGHLHRSLTFSLIAALPIHLWHVNFMMPFFVLGLLWHCHPYVLQRQAKLIGWVSASFFLMLWPWWDGCHTTYITPLLCFRFQSLQFLLLQNFDSYLLRLTIGMSATLVILSWSTRMQQPHRPFPFLLRLGQHTLEIYVLHSFLIHTGLLQSCAIPYVVGWYEATYCLPASVLLIGGCELVRKMMMCSRLLRYSVFGIEKS